MNHHANEILSRAAVQVLLVALAIGFALVSPGLGPAPAEAGVDRWTDAGPEGGAVARLVVDPDAPGTVYAAGPGLFVSGDGGRLWQRLRGGLPEQTLLSDLAVSSGAGGPPVLWALSQANTIDENYGVSLPDDRVYRSDDGGATWSQRGEGTLPTDLCSITELPTQPRTTLAAGTERIYRSLDSGLSWQVVHEQGPFGCDQFTGRRSRFVLDPGDLRTAYASGGPRRPVAALRRHRGRDLPQSRRRTDLGPRRRRARLGSGGLLRLPGPARPERFRHRLRLGGAPRGGSVGQPRRRRELAGDRHRRLPLRLPARPHPRHRWRTDDDLRRAFSGALTHLGHEITFVDTETGLDATFTHPGGRPASGVDLRAIPVLPPPAAGAPLAEELPDGPLAEAPAGGPFAPEPAEASECDDWAFGLCLLDRFDVRIIWRPESDGGTYWARAIPVTAEAGVFRFAGPDNVEVAVKVLDGRAVNGHFWVFWGGMTGRAFTLRIVDTQSARLRTWEVPAGRPASSADLAAFE